jgi:hypothetical protein
MLTSALAWLSVFFVNEMPNFTGVMARPRRCVGEVRFSASISTRRFT